MVVPVRGSGPRRISHSFAAHMSVGTAPSISGQKSTERTEALLGHLAAKKGGLMTR